MTESTNGNSGFVQEFNKISELQSTSAASRAKLLSLVKKTGLVKTKNRFTGKRRQGNRRQDQDNQQPAAL
jgi:hypothetical protein